MKTQSYNLFATLLLLMALPLLSPAQYGYSSASMSMGKMRSESRALPAPAEIVLEEYFNYHRHKIALPTGDDRVALDLQWGSPELCGQNGERILQVGIATGTAASLDQLPPVNVSLVIDKSGSMAGDRIARAREAAHAFLDRLRPGDIFSVVAFDHSVEVVVPAAPIEDKAALHRAIDRIRDEGSTNLDLGMLTGYEQLIRHQKRGQTNRIIMLTDALTNTGITDPQEMIRHSKLYTEDFQVDFTIVGVGVDFNQGLSRQLSGSSNSSIFFVNDAEDIKKVFIDEVESLLSAIGRDVVLEIEVPEGVEIAEIYGYSPVISGKMVRIPLENLNGGLTMVALLRLKLLRGGEANLAQVKVRLRYFDIAEEKHLTLNSESPRDNSSRQSYASAAEVSKNYHIALMASALREMAGLAATGQSNEAAIPINRILDQVHARYPGLKDPDIKLVVDILDKYEGELVVENAVNN
jgi:uncharacterized protein YegL